MYKYLAVMLRDVWVMLGSSQISQIFKPHLLDYYGFKYFIISVSIMVKFERSYEDEEVVGRLYTILSDLGAKTSLKGKSGFMETGEPVYFFSNKTGDYVLKQGIITAEFAAVSEPKPEKGKPENRYITFEIERNVYRDTIDIEARSESVEVERIKDILNKIENGKKLGEADRQKLKWEFTNPQKASENLFKVLDEMKVKYRIKPRSQDKQPEYIHDASIGRDYLIKGIVEVEDRDVSFELETTFGGGFSIYAVSDPKSKDFIKEVLEKVEPERVETVEKKTIKRFGGKKVRISDYKWNDIGGLENVKDEIREAIEWPLKNYEVFDYLGIRMPKGILLHGPPGNGKTLLAKIIASESEAYFFQASAAELTSMWYGVAEKLVKELFNNAREYKPSIIFLDEFDGLFTSRDKGMYEATRRMLGVFLQELDGLEELKGTVVLAATNRYEDLDPAIIRPGRFDRIIEIPLPDSQGRRQIFGIHTKKMPLSDVNFDELAKITEEYSGADIESVCQRAGYNALRKYMKERNVKIDDIRGVAIKELKITQDDFEGALKQLKPSQN